MGRSTHLQAARPRNVERCERKFGIPSECIHQAIDDGTLEVVEWILDYNLLCRAGER